MIADGLAYRWFWFILSGLWLGIILFVIFHLLTVRRLHKDPEIRERLGIGFMPGWEAQSVAAAVTVPRRFTRWARRGRLRELYADCDTVYQSTSRAERCLGRVCYVTLMGSVTLFLICYGIDKLNGIRFGS